MGRTGWNSPGVEKGSVMSGLHSAQPVAVMNYINIIFFRSERY